MVWRTCRITLGLVLMLLALTMCAAPQPGATATLAPPLRAPAPGTPSAPVRAHGTTYYVRPDGGSATQCTGLADAPYPGSGTGQACAWDHPFRALPPEGTPTIAGGDTLLIGAGSYRMGYGAPGADACDSDYPWDCHMPPVPSGPSPTEPTRILGAGWDAGCPQPPELWGTERAWLVLNLTGTDNAQIACLEVTDHAGCVDGHSGGLACERDTYPYGDWAPVGLYAEDAANISLRHLDIHGLAVNGVHAGRLTDWTVEDVRIAANGWAGWDGDIDGDDSNAGTLTFRRWTVAWNGCAETYPDAQPAGCWGQSAGGYGDGVGTGATTGHWVIEDSAFLYNTSDGLDLLYARAGSRIEVRRTRAEGNAGNQIKTNGLALIENTVAVGNCGYFDGQAFTHDVDNCRAAGNTLSLAVRPGDTVTVVNSTVTGEGDCLLIAECAEGTCDGSEAVRLRNTIFHGHPDFLAPGEQTCLVWTGGFPHDPVTLTYDLINAVKTPPDPCPAHSLCGVAPGLVDEGIDSFDAHLTATSPAIDQGTPAGAPLDDFDGLLRDAQPDLGAYEWDAGATPTVTETAYLPLMVTEAPGGQLAVDDFLYQLQNLDLTAIGATAYDLVVMDYSAEGDDATAFSAAEIAALKASAGGAKLVLAYMSIGEAEDYRFYWQTDWVPGDPAWLDEENPDWGGNYKVHYWDPAWQAIVLTYTDKLLDAGFDGAYLDLIDAYEHYADQGRATAAQEMADFVAAIRAHARARDPGFLIFPQNGAELAGPVPAYLDSVDGIGQEDIYYGYEADDVMTPPAVTAELEAALADFCAAGKLVLTVDYATTPAHIDDAYAKSEAQGYVPFVTVRDLDQLVVNPGHEPD